MKVRRIGSIEYNAVRALMIVNIWWIGVRLYKDPIRSIRVLRLLISNFKQMIGNDKMVRAFKSDSGYNWDMFNPAWPSKSFNSFYRSHLKETDPKLSDDILVRRLFVAITKRCPLQCEHCSEADTLYQSDVLSYEELSGKIDAFVTNGVGQLIYSGGEPLSRYNDLLKLIKRYKDNTDQWLYTSGYGLDSKKAKELKESGLNGVAISLDHHQEEKHNLFRGNKNSYRWVLDAIRYLQDEGILVSINVCCTKQYISEGGPDKMIEFAREMNVPIVNLIDPRAVGNYQNKNVELNPEEKEILTSLSQKYNFDKKFVEYPTVLFPAGYRKTLKCGGGRSYLFLDYDGRLYPCPFCKTNLSEIPKKRSESLCKAG